MEIHRSFLSESGKVSRTRFRVVPRGPHRRGGSAWFRGDARSGGMGVIEIVVAAAILVLIAVGVFTVGRYAITAQRAVTLDRRATLIAAESLAVARLERDGNWATFSGRPLNTPLYPTFSGSTASLSTTDPGSVDGIFTATVTLDDVYRNVSGDIDPGGTTLDSDAREVTVEVTWTTPSGAQKTFTDSAYLMNI